MRFDEIPHSLVEQAQSGNHQAMESLCEMILPGAYAVLLSILRDSDEAADALQEALLRVVRFLPTLREPALLPGWLMRTLVNQANTSRKKMSATIIDVMNLDDSSGENRIAAASAASPSPRAMAATVELSQHINQAVAELPARQKTALILFEMEQLTIREVASIMELTDGAVKFHLHEARKNLRERLVEMGVTASDLTGEELA